MTSVSNRSFIPFFDSQSSQHADDAAPPLDRAVKIAAQLVLGIKTRKDLRPEDSSKFIEYFNNESLKTEMLSRLFRAIAFTNPQEAYKLADKYFLENKRQGYEEVLCTIVKVMASAYPNQALKLVESIHCKHLQDKAGYHVAKGFANSDFARFQDCVKRINSKYYRAKCCLNAANLLQKSDPFSASKYLTDGLDSMGEMNKPGLQSFQLSEIKRRIKVICLLDRQNIIGNEEKVKEIFKGILDDLKAVVTLSDRSAAKCKIAQLLNNLGYDEWAKDIYQEVFTTLEQTSFPIEEQFDLYDSGELIPAYKMHTKYDFLRAIIEELAQTHRVQAVGYTEMIEVKIKSQEKEEEARLKAGAGCSELGFMLPCSITTSATLDESPVTLMRAFHSLAKSSDTEEEAEKYFSKALNVKVNYFSDWSYFREISLIAKDYAKINPEKAFEALNKIKGISKENAIIGYCGIARTLSQLDVESERGRTL